MPDIGYNASMPSSTTAIAFVVGMVIVAFAGLNVRHRWTRGSFELKGVPEPQEGFGLRESALG